MRVNEIKYKVITSGENPQLVGETQKKIGAEWPEFMLHDPVADGLADCYDKLPEFQFVLADPKTGEPVSVANSIPLAYDGKVEDLPDEGWDWALTKGLEDFASKKRPSLLCALQVVVFGDGRGKGISRQAVAAMKAIGARHGLSGLIAPVRPSNKSQYPLTPMDRYVRWTGDEGLPFDAWMRVHARLGARVIKPCPKAMDIKGTVAEWESWTGMRFPESGTYTVPGALIPIEIDRDADLGTYIEPNVWMYHPPMQAVLAAVQSL